MRVFEKILTLKMSSASKRFTPAIKALIAETSRQVFGNLPIVPYRTGFSYLKQKPTGKLAASYYLPDLTRSFKKLVPDYVPDLMQRRMDQIDRMKRRGKSIPKKGHGKRASKGKK